MNTVTLCTEVLFTFPLPGKEYSFHTKISKVYIIFSLKLTQND